MFVAASFGGVAALTPTTAHAQFGGLENTTSSYGSNVSSCEIQTVGWVICPVMRSIAKLADYGFAFINQNFLKIEYGITNTQSGVYKAWEVMRTVANALFVVAFMVIVYAQVTGKSAGGYNIKRMLPRLIIAAILVNVSYYVCVIGIELSNIIGGSILTIMQNISDRIGPSAMTLSSAANGFDDSRLSDITNAVLQKTGTVWILLAPVAAVTVSIAVVCAVGLVLLIMRKVVVAMLVLVSPLMFVAYLLPNTDKYFQQWIRLLFQLLLLYPVIAFLLGTGQIISATIMNVGSGSDSNYRVKDDSYQARNGGSGSATTDLAAAGAAVLPLLGTWFLLKSLSSVVTNTGSKVAGNISRRGKKDEEKIKAQMDSKSKQAAAGLGNGLPTYDRKPAFSRLRRRRPGAGAATLPQASDTLRQPTVPGGAASGTTPPSLFDRAIGNVNNATLSAENQKANDDTANKGVADATETHLADGQAALAAQDDKKGKTAKDIFNNMNKSRQMGGGSNNNGNSSETSPGSATPTPPSNNYQAAATPTIATQQQQQPQVIAVPVAVDASSLLKKPGGGGTANGLGGLEHTPSTETQSKAKERANKYMFESQNDLEKASDRLEEIEAIRKEQAAVAEKQKDKPNKDTH